jgi:UDP-N-acetyl-D-mannosaminuronic acid dehydrogenase
MDLTELYKLPQIVGARTTTASERAIKLFRSLASATIDLNPEEAELAKLFANTWRYMQFAAANQLYMVATELGVDFARIRDAVTFEYPRAAGLPSAGFTAGPCLPRDVLQLSACTTNFPLGRASIEINEGLPLFVVARMERLFDLSSSCVGILGMGFKAESQDTRSSLSYRLRDILTSRAKRVMCTDPFQVDDPRLDPLDEVLDEGDVLIIAAPHADYRTLKVRQPIVDIWSLRSDGITL